MNEILRAAAHEVYIHHLDRNHTLQILRRGERNPFQRVYYQAEIIRNQRIIRAAKAALEALQ